MDGSAALLVLAVTQVANPVHGLAVFGGSLRPISCSGGMVASHLPMRFARYLHSRGEIQSSSVWRRERQNSRSS
jgi:hypothetical protein